MFSEFYDAAIVRVPSNTKEEGEALCGWQVKRERIRTCMIKIVSGSSELVCTDWGIERSF